MEKITYAIIILAVIVLLLYVGISVKSIQEIKEKLNVKEKCARTDNGCDVCCKECQDADVCIGCCSHAQNGKGEKENGKDKL